ncbi:lipase [Auricularia subglabra TFB-10046 SS5]|nr:lipase [Auricularia subglabra TFB-10046 SS5]
MIGLAVLALAPVAVLGAAILPRDDEVVPLESSQLTGFSPYAFFAASAYCDPILTTNWTCGPNCDGVADFIPTAVGGDGVFMQFWYVGYYPPLNSVVVSHQGTKPANIIPLLTDVDFVLEDPDEEIFPGLEDQGIKIHNGFHDQHTKAFADVFAAVQQTMAERGTNNIMVAGHSLGGALGVLDAIAMQIRLPDARIQIVTFGQPRLGNQEFADYIDAHFPGTVRFTNKRDLVPTIPGRFTGYAHFSTEIHIREDESIVLCHGRDNTDCIIKDVPTVFSGDLFFHRGPYNGVIMKCPENDKIGGDGSLLDDLQDIL